MCVNSKRCIHIRLNFRKTRLTAHGRGGPPTHGAGRATRFQPWERMHACAPRKLRILLTCMHRHKCKPTQLCLYMAYTQLSVRNQHIHNMCTLYSEIWLRPRMIVLVQDHFYSDILNLHVTSQATKDLWRCLFILARVECAWGSASKVDEQRLHGLTEQLFGTGFTS